MGLFGKKKTPEEVLAEGRALYEQGEYLDAALKLLKVNGNLNGEIDYWLGLSYLTYDQKRGKTPGRYEKFTVKYLTRSAQAGQPGAARLLAEQFGVRDYLPAEPKADAPEPEVKSEPKPGPKPQPDAAPSPDMDDLFALAEETGALIQEAQAQARQFTAREKSRPEPKPAPRPEPQPVPAPEPKPEPKLEPKPEPTPQPVPKAEAPVEKPISEMSDDEIYQKGMELFKAGDYDGAYSLLRRVCMAIGPKKNAYPAGQAVMGWMHEQGRGVEASDSRARRHYSIAAKKGDKDGMAGVARMTAKIEAPTVSDCQTALDYARQLVTDEAALIPVLEQKLHEAQMRETAEAEEQQRGAELKQIFHDGAAAYEAKEYEKALSLFEKAAEQGHADAQFKCGVMYDNGEGTTVDKAKALYWFERAAEQGNAAAQFNCGNMYRKGEGTAVDKAKALYWYEKAAEQGVASAQSFCGVLYDKGEGTAVDKTKALYWYEKAAEQGHVGAQFNYGMMYNNGESTAADKAKALYWIEKAAEQGNAAAQFNCGVMYDNGVGTAVDKAKALYWFEKAAEQGDAHTLYGFGLAYSIGIRTAVDKTKALYWFEKAAERGDAEAQTMCAEIYNSGKGTAVDKAKALYWFEKAAEQGIAEAQFNCGVEYFNGESTAKDKAKAKAYFQKAAAQTEDKKIQEEAKKILLEYF